MAGGNPMLDIDDRVIHGPTRVDRQAEAVCSAYGRARRWKY